MSYQVLARKWRPRAFSDMVGQEHVLRMLANALDQKRLHHAYLLTGTRGVGKTTLGRILAKCLNCETGITSKPCLTCSTCRAIDAGQFLDLYEVDAASRTKVEDTLELLGNVLYPPTQGRYKIYLIDEVHMLSNHSFNALLKTLEEPPEHVKFLLATTDPKRLPITILSRCLQFHLKRITPDQIAPHLQHICNAESIAYESDALNQLAKAADGSMRDALSLLDQAIAYGHGSVNQVDVNAMLGSLSQDDLLPLLQALSTQEGPQLFDCLHQLSEHAPDFQQVLEALISAFHHIAMAQIVPNTMGLDENIAAFATQFTPEDVQLYYQIALLGRRDLSLAPSPQQGFEMTMLRMLAFKPSTSTSTTSTTPATSTPVAAKAPVATKPTSATVPTSTTWRDILPKLNLSGMTQALASNCVLESIIDNKVTLLLSENHQPMLNPKSKERLTEALSQHFGKPIQLDIRSTDTALNTPVKQQQQEENEQITQAKASLLQEPHIKQLIETYDATLDVTLVS